MKYMKVTDLRQLSTGMKAVFKPTAESDTVAAAAIHVNPESRDVMLCQNSDNSDAATNDMARADLQGYRYALRLGNLGHPGVTPLRLDALPTIKGFRILVPNSFPTSELPLLRTEVPAPASAATATGERPTSFVEQMFNAADRAPNFGYQAASRDARRPRTTTGTSGLR